MVSEPGPSLSSQSVVGGDAVGAAAAAVLDDPVGRLRLDDRRCPSRPRGAARRRESARPRRRRPGRSG